MANAGVKVVISAADRASATLEKINKRIAGLQAPVRRAQAAFGRFASLSGLNRLRNGFFNLGREVLGAFRYVGQLVPALGAITGASSLAGMYRLVDAWGAFGTKLRTVSGSMGMAPQKLQAMQNAARLSGSSAEAMTSALQTLSQTRWNAANNMDPRALAQFKAMHLDLRALAKEPIDQFFNRVAHAIRGLKDPVSRTVAATALLGGAGEQLQSIWQETDEQWKKDIETGKRHAWMTKEMADRADIYQRSQKELTLSVEHFGDTIADAASPALVDLNHFLSDIIDKNRDWIAQDIGGYVKQFSYWFRNGGWEKIKQGMIGAAESVKSVVNALGGWKSAGKDALIAMGLLYATPVIAGLTNLGASILNVASAFAAMKSSAEGASAASEAAALADAGQKGSILQRAGGTALRAGGAVLRGGLYGALAYGEYKLLTGEPFRTGGGRDTVIQGGPLPKDIYEAGTDAAQKYGIDPSHFLALLQTEAGGYNKTSKAGAFGPAQLMPATARSLGVADSANAANYNWRDNLDAGARYYKSLLGRFHGDYMAAYAGYNAGPNSDAVQEYARTHIDSGLPSETQHYLASNAALAGSMMRQFERTRQNLSATSSEVRQTSDLRPPDPLKQIMERLRIELEIDHKNVPPGTVSKVRKAPPGASVNYTPTQRAMPPEYTSTGM